MWWHRWSAAQPSTERAQALPHVARLTSARVSHLGQEALEAKQSIKVKSHRAVHRARDLSPRGFSRECWIWNLLRPNVLWHLLRATKMSLCWTGRLAKMFMPSGNKFSMLKPMKALWFYLEWWFQSYDSWCEIWNLTTDIQVCIFGWSLTFYELLFTLQCSKKNLNAPQF